MKTLAPEIFRKRQLLEGYFDREVNESVLVEFFAFLTNGLALRTYGAPIIHATSGQGKDSNQGYDAFVPLIDSGIYVAIWSNQKFLSVVLYTCKDFDERKAAELVREFFNIKEIEYKLF